METPIVVNYKTDPFDIWIGRHESVFEPRQFGNPFVVGVHGIRGECVQKYEKWLRTGDRQNCRFATDARREYVLNHLHLLAGKRIACACKPRPCHGDVLVQLFKEKYASH